MQGSWAGFFSGEFIQGLNEFNTLFHHLSLPPTHTPKYRPQNQNSILHHKFYSRCGIDSFCPPNESYAALERTRKTLIVSRERERQMLGLPGLCS
jgi:hypothetical protein